MWMESWFLVKHPTSVQPTYRKDLHGMRDHYLNHRDKQNHDAVVQDLLAEVSDSNATIAYLSIIHCVVVSFLDKQPYVTARIEKAWYAVLFLRYWKSWLLSQPDYNLDNNFVTQNAFNMCVEMNAQSLITFVRMLRDVSPTENECFLRWMLGSQTREKIFRTAHSMSSTFLLW